MLKIRSEQMKVFEPAANEAFARWLIDYVREEHANVVVTLPQGSGAVAALAVETVDEMVRRGIERARSHGIDSNSAISAFVTLMFVMAPNFDGHPVIRHLLRESEFTPDQRLERLFEVTTDESWDAIVDGYDANAWGLKGASPERG
jgi:hypothetical protein